LTRFHDPRRFDQATPGERGRAAQGLDLEMNACSNCRRLFVALAPLSEATTPGRAEKEQRNCSRTVHVYEIPRHRDYAYAYVNERRVIVEPRTRKVVRVIE
jgi:hypothetical protein